MVYNTGNIHYTYTFIHINFDKYKKWQNFRSVEKIQRLTWRKQIFYISIWTQFVWHIFIQNKKMNKNTIYSYKITKWTKIQYTYFVNCTCMFNLSFSLHTCILYKNYPDIIMHFPHGWVFMGFQEFSHGTLLFIKRYWSHYH